MNNRNKKIKIAAIAGTILVGSVFAMHSEKASANVFSRGLRSLRTSLSRALGLRSGSTGRMGPTITPKHQEVASLKASNTDEVILTRVASGGNVIPKPPFEQPLAFNWQDITDGAKGRSSK